MHKRTGVLRRRVTFANTMSGIAVLIALSSGAAVAAQQINGKQLKARSVAGSKLARNTLGGSEINESRLARVPSATNASKLGGFLAEQYGLAGGSTYSFRLAADLLGNHSYTIDNLGVFKVDCLAGPTTQITFQNGLPSAIGPAIFPRMNGLTTAIVNSGSIASSGTYTLVTEADPDDSTIARGVIQVGNSAAAWFEVVVHNAPGAANTCTARVQVYRDYKQLD